MLCVFDVNETLLDLAALDEIFTRLTGSPDARREWFDLLIRTALTVTATRSYRDFAEIAGSSVGVVAERYGRVATDDDRVAVGTLLRSLPAHPDVPPALARLRSAGFTLVTLTNSPLATAQAQLTHSGLIGSFDGVFSAEQAGLLKPAPEPYHLVTTTLNVKPDEAIMIASHDWDIAGAHAAGLRTGFVARPGHQLLPGASSNTLTAPDLNALADLLIADA